LQVQSRSLCTHPFVPSLCRKNTAQGGESLAQSPAILGFDRDLHTVIEVRSVFMAMRGSIAPVQSHPSGVIDIGTPGGVLMKSEALKRGRNPGIKKDFKPDTPRRLASKRRENTRGVARINKNGFLKPQTGSWSFRRGVPKQELGNE
jgi:hypothetical protein